MKTMYIIAFILIALPSFVSRLVPEPLSSLLIQTKNFMALLNTIIHEVCHGLTAFLTGGKLKGIRLNSDLSGVATTLTKSKWSLILVKLVGYTGASFFTYQMLYMLVEEEYELLGILLFFFYFVTFLFIRNAFGMVWIISIGLVTIGFYFLDKLELLLPFYSFMVIFSAIESFFSSMRVWGISLYSKEKSDATDLRDITKIPVMVWGTLFGLVGVYFFYLQLQLIFG